MRENFAWVFRFHVVGIFPLQYEIESLTMPNLRSKLFALPTIIMLIQAFLQYTHYIMHAFSSVKNVRIPVQGVEIVN